MSERARAELAALVKRAEQQRRRIKQLQEDLEILHQRIAAAEGKLRPERRRRPRPPK
jgi:hypothetical protein